MLRAGSGAEAQETLHELRKRGEALALVLADQRMPGMTGVELLESARELFPKAKRALLTAYADTDAAIDAINRAQIDYYLQKPWDPPEERLYPTLEDLLGDWEANAPGRRPRGAGRRPPLLARLARGARPARPQPDPLRVARPRPRPRGAPAARRRRHRRGPAARHVPARRRGARGADAARARDAARHRDPGGARLLRPDHRRRRPGRARGGGVRRVRGAAHRARGARGARRPGRPELADRELPRLPERPLRRRPRAPRARPGAPLRRRAAAGPAGRQARGARTAARRHARRRRASSPATAC